jgi:hypothetical protein
MLQKGNKLPSSELHGGLTLGYGNATLWWLECFDDDLCIAKVRTKEKREKNPNGDEPSEFKDQKKD